MPEAEVTDIHRASTGVEEAGVEPSRSAVTKGNADVYCFLTFGVRLPLFISGFLGAQAAHRRSQELLFRKENISDITGAAAKKEKDML